MSELVTHFVPRQSTIRETPAEAGRRVCRWWPVLFCFLSIAGCAGPNWQLGNALLVSPLEVSAALGDAPDGIDHFDATALPQIERPHGLRPCCAFGMDLMMDLGRMPLEGYEIANIVSTDTIGRHEYDNGAVSIDGDFGRLVTIEKNGLAYTCRGGFVDLAHVRDNADLTLYLTMQLAAVIPGPAVITIPGDGAIRRVAVRRLPDVMVAKYGRLAVASAIAQWVAFQMSVWHELTQWYRLESVRGFSEKVSAFSLEDLYSNMIGIRIAAGILGTGYVHSRRDWDRQMDAWIPAVLDHLHVLPVDLGRRAMHSVDGLWWDSKRRLPDWKLVRRRNTDISTRQKPWRVADAGLPPDPVLDAACSERDDPLTVGVPDHGDGFTVEQFITVDFEVGAWAKTLPFADKRLRRLTQADFPRLVEAIRPEFVKTFGEGFDRPGPVPLSP